MDFPRPVIAAALHSAVPELTLRRATQVTKVSAGASARDADSQSGRPPGQERGAAEARDVAALRREMERRDLPPGPPPAFKLNLLEIDGEVRQAIARAEVRRAQGEVSGALRPEGAQAAGHGETAASPPPATQDGPPDTR